MRVPYVINNNTRLVYTPSENCHQILGEQGRHVFPEDLTWGDSNFPTLITLCVQAISQSFKVRQILEELHCADRDYLLEILSITLPLELTIPLINVSNI